AGAGAGDDVVQAAAVEVAGRHPDAAGEVLAEGEEVVDDRAVLAGEDGDVGPAARVRAADDVREAVAVHVAGRDEDAAGEVLAEGEEAADQLPGLAVVDVDVRPAARPRRGDDVGHAVAVHVADRDADAAGEVLVVSE